MHSTLWLRYPPYLMPAVPMPMPVVTAIIHVYIDGGGSRGDLVRSAGADEVGGR